MDKGFILRRSLSAITAFILSVSLFAFSIALSLALISSQGYIDYVEKESKYAALSFEQLKVRLSDLTIPSGLPTDFFDSRLQFQLYEERSKNYFDTVARSAPLSFSKEDVIKEFYTLAHDYALTQNRVISDEAKISLQGFAEECSDVYMNFVSPSSVRYVLTVLPSLKSPALYGSVVTAILTLGAAVLLFFLCRNRDAAKHFYFAFSAAALMSGSVPAFLLITREVERVSISSASLHSLTVCFVEGVLWLLVITAAFYALVSAAALSFSHILKKRKTA